MIIFFPDFRAWNPYQTLLYEGLPATPASDFQELLAICESAVSLPQIIHLHWLSPITGLERVRATQHAQALQSALSRARDGGAKLVFTVHNLASHEAANPDLERSLTAWLVKQADVVHVHHPSVLEPLQRWLGPVDARWVVAEHGPYRHAGTINAQAVFEVFDLEPDAESIVVPGQLRAYKNIEFIAEVLRDWVPPTPRTRVVFVGGITPGADPRLVDQLRRLPFVRFGRRILDHDGFSAMVQQARAVWLSYREISTSGSLFHALSAGTPAIALALGTLPFYVQPGVNGFLHAPGDVQTARAWLTVLAGAEPDFLERLREGARRSVDHLGWAVMRNRLFGADQASEAVSSPALRPKAAAHHWVIIDPGLRDTLTHHHAVNGSLRARLRSEGVSVSVLGHRALEAFPEAGQAVFECSLYADMPSLDEVPYQRLVRAHARDLAAGSSRLDLDGARSTWVIHTATAALLQAIATHLAQVESPPVAVLVQLMFHPHSFGARGADGDRAERRYALALRALRSAARTRGVALRLSTSCRSFVQTFEALSGAAVALHPFALLSESQRLRHADGISSRTERAVGQEVVLYTGDLKLEKGAGWIVESLPLLLQRFPEVFFTVHWSSNRFHHPALEALGHRLRQLAASRSRLRLLEGPLSPHEWQSCLRDASLMVLPYDPTVYAMRTSGIFWERLFWNRTVGSLVVTAGSWMAREADELGIKVGRCEYGDDASLVEALEKGLAAAATAPVDPSAVPVCFAQGNDEFLWQQWRSIVGEGTS